MNYLIKLDQGDQIEPGGYLGYLSPMEINPFDSPSNPGINTGYLTQIEYLTPAETITFDSPEPSNPGLMINAEHFLTPAEIPFNLPDVFSAAFSAEINYI
jgi:hypothetical protein